MKDNITIDDVARMANVSQATVSFVLNDKKGVSQATRDKVLSVIRQLNYRPTLNSKRLYYQKSFTIAVVFDQSVHTSNNLFYYDILNALLKRCMAYNYVLVYTEYRVEGDEPILPDNILNKDVDGLIFLKEIPLVLISRLDSLKIPFVVVDDHSAHTSLYTVRTDYRLAAYTAVRHLICQGHKSIGFVGNANIPAFYLDTLTGYQDALREADLPLDLAFCYNSIDCRGKLEEAFASFRESTNRPTAFFCMEDLLAIELIRFCQKAGIAVPEELSVIAIDDIIPSDMIYPGLTTIALEKEEMSYCAIDILIDLISGKKTQSKVVPSNRIVIRDSVGKLAD